jgi:hypothetical protein
MTWFVETLEEWMEERAVFSDMGKHAGSQYRPGFSELSGWA